MFGRRMTLIFATRWQKIWMKHWLAESGMGERFHGAVVMLRHDGDDSTGLLRKLAQDASPMVSSEAIGVLGRHESPQNTKVLQGLLKSTNRPEVQANAASALGNYKQTDPEQLVALMNGAENLQVRVGAAKGLARLAKHQRKAAAGPLFEALKHPDAGVRAWAIAGIYNASGYRFPKYDAGKTSETQASVIAFIQLKLCELELIPCPE